MTNSTSSYSISNMNDLSRHSDTSRNGFMQLEKRNFTKGEDDSATNTTTSDDDDDTTSTSSSKEGENNDDKFDDNLEQHPPLRSDAWSEVSAEKFHIRGKTYMNDKIKQPSEESAFKLLSVDLVKVQTPIYSGMCSHPDERIQKALRREKYGETLGGDIRNNDEEFLLPQFVFALNLCIPAAADNGFYHAVFYFGADKDQMDEIKQGTTPFSRVMDKFIFGNCDEYRNKSLKLIPRVADGNYIIKHAIGTKPVILGKEMNQIYVKGERYLEVIVDISSNHVANGITKLCLGYITNLSIDLMFVVEGHDESTLPERILGGARISHLDFQTKDGKRTVVS